jgi:peptidoglycan-associated lipoprotein
MPMRSKIRLVTFCIFIGLITLATACHKKTPAAAVPAAAPAAAPPPAAPGPPTCTLTAAPATVTLGQAVTLNWISSDATTINLNPGLGSQQAQGSTSVTPSASTTYAIALSGPGGSGECSARVTVTPPVSPSPSVSESNIPGASGAIANSLQDAFFDYNQSNLRPDAQAALTHDAAYLKSHPDVKIRIGGYCDQRGSEQYNLGLGERRADSAQQFLVNLGVAADRISTVSYGKDRPFCTQNTDPCYQENRRAQLVMAAQ